jgi:hypothetical protein
MTNPLAFRPEHIPPIEFARSLYTLFAALSEAIKFAEVTRRITHTHSTGGVYSEICKYVRCPERVISSGCLAHARQMSAAHALHPRNVREQKMRK